MTLAPTSGTKTSKPTSATKANERTSASDAAAAKLEYTVIVAVRDHHDDKEFLMVRHSKRGWELPGGKFEPGEGPVHCALREFREETGHLLADPHFVTKIKKDNGICFVFTGRLGSETEPKEDAEPPLEMKWFTKLPRGEKLAFPDDSYKEIGRLLTIDFG